MASAAALLPGKFVKAMAALNKPVANSFHKLRLGSLDLTVVSDGFILFDKVQPGFAPGIDSVKVKQVLSENFLPSDHVDLGLNVLVVRNKGGIILIDSGCGFRFGKGSGKLVGSLKEAGIQPDDVTAIALTHGHPDHLGGLVNETGASVFKNARIYLSRIEKEFWLASKQDFSHSRMRNEALKKMVIDIAQDTLQKLEHQLVLFEDKATVLGCLRMDLTPGHTPGHTAITIFSNGEELVHTGDLVHSAVLSFAHPEWGFDGDTNFDEAIITREKVLLDLSNNKKQIFSYHLPWPGLGHVRKKEAGFEWVHGTYALPD